MKYRKKPVVIEAVQYTPDMTPPQWLVDAQAAGIFCQTRDADGDSCWCIKTLEGEMVVSPNDWIIKGVKGELYPCSRMYLNKHMSQRSHDERERIRRWY